MEREQIIKAMEHCFSDRPCSECEWHEVGNGCLGKLEQSALSLIKELTEENKKLEYTLAGVMHFVDKWLDGAELEQDEVNRAITMREKTLQIVEKLTDENERLRAIPEQLHKEMSERMVEERKIERKLTVRKMQERLKPYEYRLSCHFCKHSLRGNRNEKCDEELRCGGWNKWESVIDQIAKEMLEGE